MHILLESVVTLFSWIRWYVGKREEGGKRKLFFSLTYQGLHSKIPFSLLHRRRGGEEEKVKDMRRRRRRRQEERKKNFFCGFLRADDQRFRSLSAHIVFFSPLPQFGFFNMPYEGKEDNFRENSPFFPTRIDRKITDRPSSPSSSRQSPKFEIFFLFTLPAFF